MIQGLLIIVLMAGTFLLPAPAVALNEPLPDEEEQTIAPSVARQGDFALRLAQSLGLPAAEDEEGAIRALNALGIHAVDGWTADYPMTPQVVAELRDAVIATAAAGQLNMSLDAAMSAYAEVAAEFGLPPPVDLAPGYAGGGGPASAYVPSCDGTALGYYYDSFGTPIYTYCRPPPAYFYLYSWVPCGFQWQGRVFTGFFILNHFNRIPPHAHVQHVDWRHRAEGRTGEKHDRDDRSHRRVFQTTTPQFGDLARTPPHERRHEFSDDSHRHAATTGVGNKEIQRRQWQALHASHPKANVAAGAVPSPAAPDVAIIRRAHSDRVWTGARPAASAALAPVAPIPHTPARVGLTPALVQAPSVVAPIERRSVSRETSGWGSSDSRGAARAGGLGFR
jgi:hypothetical protein